MSTLNLGILAHVDAGKTSLTERLLHTAGVIDHVGRVDHGDTRTDTLALEQQRGITIKSAVTSFELERTEIPGGNAGPVTVNLIDTPGHPDFIAEVERVLEVLDAVVLVVSAVEGVQAQTRILTRALRRLKIPTLIFVNKIDRAGARSDRLLPAVRRRLELPVVAMGQVESLGTRVARFVPYRDDDPDFLERLSDVLTMDDDRLLARYLDRGGPDIDDLGSALRHRTADALVHPLYFGSALTGAGVDHLIRGIERWLPTVDPISAPTSGVVFKIDRGPAGEKISYLRMSTGSLTIRDSCVLSRSDAATVRFGKITAINTFARGAEAPADRIGAGTIGKVWGLAEAQIGDRVSDGSAASKADPVAQQQERHFTLPSLETVVEPVDPADRGRLRSALDLLAEQDPLINVGQDDERGELSVSLYGEVQKEVIGATLQTDFAIPVTFAETSTVCVERPVRTGAAVIRIRAEGNPFLATVGLRVEPAQQESGIGFAVETPVLGTMPLAFFTAIEDTVRHTAQRALKGWRLIDALITLTQTGYAPRQSHAHQSFNKAMSSTGADFRDLTPLVLMAALQDAGTVVLEPIHRFALELPSELLPVIYPVLASRRAVPGTPLIGASQVRIDGDIPAAEIHTLEQQLPGLTRGEGSLEAQFDHYRPVVGPPPYRRTIVPAT